MIERSKLKGMKQGSESSSVMRPRPAPRSLGASRAEVRALERSRVRTSATAELPVKVDAAHELAWDDRPTPLRARFLRGPQDSDPDVLVLHLHDRPAAFAAAATRAPSKWRVRLTEVRRYLVDFDLLDALTFDATEILADEAVLALDHEAWRIIKAIAAQKADCVKIASASGDALLVFRHALGRVVVERDAEIYAVDRHGVGRRNPPKTRVYETWFRHALIAIPAAILGDPLIRFLLEHADVTIPVPAFVPAAGVVLAVFAFIHRKHR